MSRRKLPRNATLTDLTNHMLQQPMPTSDDPRDCLMELSVRPTCAAAIVFGMIQKAAKGDTSAAKFLKEMNGEKVDIVLYSKDPVEFIKSALSPAKNLSVYILDEKTKETLVIVDKDNLSLAIGKKGINVKLATRLTNYKLDIKTEEQVRESGINILTD